MIDVIAASSNFENEINPLTRSMMIKNPIPILALCLASLLTDLGAADKKVVFVAGAKSHGYFSHEHIAGSKLLAKH